MTQAIVIGLGAGAAAALLFASVATGSIFATVLFYLAPLPVMIAGLGFSHWAGLVAGLAAAGGLGAALGFYFGTAFLVGVGLPAWWLAYLALLARPAAAGGMEWYPVGRLVLWAAIIGTVVVLIAIPNFGVDKDSFQAGLRGAFERAIRMQSPPGAPDQPSRGEIDRLTDLLVVVIPPAASVLATLLNVFNLWLAGRVVRLSDHLRRPWPDLSALTLQPLAPVLLAVAIAGTFAPDLLGIASGILAASMLTAYAILGFAVLHAITRGMGHRGVALAGAYIAIAILG